MKQTLFPLLIVLIVGLTGFNTKQSTTSIDETKLISYVVDPRKAELKFYWKDQNGRNYRNFQNLRSQLEKEKNKLVFAMNGGMYTKDQSPQGLYIEKGKTLAPIDTVRKGYGNFYLQPNGIFYLTKAKDPTICKTVDLDHKENINYATRSGPLLLIDGRIHHKFIKGSKNLHIRNGVGILPNRNLLFAMSKEKINFYDLASYFKQHGCKNALYLDGFVSRTYLPSENWEQLDGNFGVMIGVTKLE